MRQLEEQRIETWREVLAYRDDFTYISPDASLYDAVKMLIDNRIHRLPLVHPYTGDVLCILTHKRLLKYLYLSDATRPQYMNKSIAELRIGTLSNIVTVHPDTSVITALKLFIQHKVSAFPVVNRDSGRCVDIYSKFDVIHLAADRSYDNLDDSIMKALERRKMNQSSQGEEQQSTDESAMETDNADATAGCSVYHCKLTNSLNEVVDLIAKAEVHRLVILDEGYKVVGLISLSDILSYLILQHPDTILGGPGGLRMGGSRCNSLPGSSSSVESVEMVHRL